jgi:hypothetical protein
MARVTFVALMLLSSVVQVSISDAATDRLLTKDTLQQAEHEALRIENQFVRENVSSRRRGG